MGSSTVFVAVCSSPLNVTVAVYVAEPAAETVAAFIGLFGGCLLSYRMRFTFSQVNVAVADVLSSDHPYRLFAIGMPRRKGYGSFRVVSTVQASSLKYFDGFSQSTGIRCCRLSHTSQTTPHYEWNMSMRYDALAGSRVSPFTPRHSHRHYWLQTRRPVHR